MDLHLVRSLAALATLLALAVAPAIATAADPGPPAFPVNDVTETFFGTPVHDPYRALEDKDAAPVQAW